ncbi:PLP-dependent aminotransferase family protein [Pantoea agglomerans]|uniref:MocR-like pyridoxine biosynthesis transcription factor PdxR n=1 Tax=Enterobacter agglomerans TaxID=549 RepID=UPI001F5BA07A|nr:PLP-dependent aminotransferase family protein [Pantoea agglomerans]
MIELRLESGHLAAPVYEQIAGQITHLITNGQLMKGDFLPPTRDLARQLRVSRGSVIRAYEQLCASGLCQGHVGKGTEVIHLQNSEGQSQTRAGYFAWDDDDLLSPAGADSLSLLPSHASTEHLPIGEFRSAFNRVLRYPDRLNRFSESRGNSNLRRLICDRILPARGITASPSEILVVPGTQYGGVLLAMTLMHSRSVFHFGSPGYMDFAHNFGRFGYKLQSHAIDSEGLSVAELAGTDRDIVYLMPEHHFPQCVTMSPARREAFLCLALQKKVLLLEDDYDSEFYFDRVPMPALRSSAAPENVIYMGTFSKVLFNSIRLGYLVAERELVEQMASLHWELSRGTNGLVQQWVAELIDSGAYARHAKRMRTVYLHKREKVSWLIRTLLPAAELTIPDGGLQMYLSFSDFRVTEKVFIWLRENNVQVASFDRYMCESDSKLNLIVLGYANADLKRLENLLMRLSSCLERL